MKVMVIGSGGREHAVVKKLRENPNIETLYVLPGNGGMGDDATCVPIKATDIDGMAAFAAEQKIDFVVVTPDDPLALGAVDRLHSLGIRCFGPDAKAAEIESSKIFAKNLMKKYGIPTARYEVFDCAAEAMNYIKTAPAPMVVKADGLALGKGVFIAQCREEANAAVSSLMEDKIFGKSGEKIIIEEYLQGPEVSVLAFTDGHTLVPMVSSMDHKRIGDGDTGPNTGGMGTIAPNPFYTDAVAKVCMETIYLPTVKAMCAEGRPFKGCLYFGLMLTQDGPKVIEYNCRFGDPETQVVLPLLKSDLLEIMLAVEEERLGEIKVEFSSGAACCVVMASKGYPMEYKTGYEIDLGNVPQMPGVRVYCAGVKEKDGRMVTGGGRVLGVTAAADTLKEAVQRAYAAVAEVSFEGAYYRKDIGKKGIN